MQDLPPPPPAEYSTYRRQGTILGLPIWGCLLIGCGCSILPIMIRAAIVFPVFAQAREKARQVTCLSNIKQISLAQLMYCQDYDEKFEPSKKWMDLMGPYLKDEHIFHCPSVRKEPAGYGYAFNSDLGDKSLEKIKEPKTTLMLFDSDNLSRNASDNGTSFPLPGRHSHGNNTGYVDGHVKWHREGSEMSLDVNPPIEQSP
jgi:prepilin-type processing-associated H-X9-DG protein